MPRSTDNPRTNTDPNAGRQPVKNLPDNSQKGKTTNLQKLVTGRDPRRRGG